MYKRLLIATDGSSCSEQGIAEGVRLAKRIGARVVFVHVMEPLPAALAAGPPGDGFPAMALYADDYFSDMRRIGSDALKSPKAFSGEPAGRCS
jgi:nucleotide-binding universal stress UspA family protein